MASRHMKGVQLIISKMHVGTVRYFSTPIGIAIAMVWDGPFIPRPPRPQYRGPCAENLAPNVMEFLRVMF